MSVQKRKREFAAFVEELCEDCVIETRSSGHLMVYITGPLGKEIVTVASTPSDGRSLMNAKAQCRRAAKKVGILEAA